MSSLSVAARPPLPWDDTMAEADRLESSEADPKKPYEFKYKARDVLQLLRASLECDDLTDSKSSAKIAVLDYRLGKNFLDTEETHDAETHLLRALKNLLPKTWDDALRASKDEDVDQQDLAHSLANQVETLPDHGFFTETIDACNQTGILWTRRGQPKRALLALDMALVFCEKVKGSFGEATTDSVEGTIEANPDQRAEATQMTAELESLNMHTLFYLAQVHSALGNAAESAMCCHRTLQMQHKTGQYSPVEWAKNALSLSEHFMLSGEVVRAEHCLKAAQQIAAEEPDPIKELFAKRQRESAAVAAAAIAASSNGDANSQQQSSAASELLNQGCTGELTAADKETLFGHPLLKVKADIHRTWGKLLSATLEGAAEEIVERRSRGEMAEAAEVKNVKDQGMDTFGLPETEKLINLTGKFSWKGRTCPEIDEIRNFESALAVFRRARAEFVKALEFYVLDGYVTDHITLQQEISKLYHNIAAFETSPKRIVAMEKRRVLLLSPLAAEINPEHYVLKTKELFYECAQAEQEIHEAHYDSVEAALQVGERPKPKDMQKSDEAILRAIGYYERFLKTMYKDGKHPDTIDKDNLPSVLGAHFAMARLYGHAYGGSSANKDFRVQMLKSALDKHTWLVQFAERNIPLAVEALANDAMLESGPEAAKKVKTDGIFKSELAICKEMIVLLPDRISQIHYSR